MRGEERRRRAMLAATDAEERAPQDHPIGSIKRLADAALRRLSPLFDQMCSDLLFRWLPGLEMDEPSLGHSTFSPNRARLLRHEAAGGFLRAAAEQARGLKPLSDERFTADGSPSEAWASLKGFKRKDAGPSGPPDDPSNPTANLHGERRANAAHQSAAAAAARLARKGWGKEARLRHAADALMEDRHALPIDSPIEPADGRAERRAAVVAMAHGRRPDRRRIAPGADQGGDTRGFVAACRALKIAARAAQNIPATPPADASANRRRRRLAGSRPSAVCARPAAADLSGRRCAPIWPPPPATSPQSRAWRRRPHQRRGRKPALPSATGQSRPPAPLKPAPLAAQTLSN